jgi:hypothetical protein
MGPELVLPGGFALTTRFTILALLSAIAGAAPARADEPEPALHPTAAERLERAKALFEHRAYGAAAAELSRAYSVDPRPALLYPWAQAERLDGNCERAIELYDAFLASGPPPRERKAAVENRALCVRATGDRPPAQDQREPGPPAPSPATPAPLSGSVAPIQPPPTDGKDPPRDERGIGALTIGLTVASAVGLGAGVFLFIDSGRRANAAAEEPFRDDVVEQMDRARLERAASFAVLAGAVGIGLWGGLRISRYLQRDDDVSVTVYPTQMVLRARF